MSSTKPYSAEFYAERHNKTVYSARTILSIVADLLPQLTSAVDFGCGVGTWLSVLHNRGVENILGLDGSWVEAGLLEVPTAHFQEADLEQELILPVKYDLAISLEVAEHLQPESASTFVHSLASAADFVLFSAAVPHQGGRLHLNEQWPDYWHELFRSEGFAFLDVIRDQIWNDRRIPNWYRQNTFLVASQSRIRDLNIPTQATPKLAATSLIHPEVFLRRVEAHNELLHRIGSVTGSWRQLVVSIKKWLKSLATR